jgi:hypothetical protein
MRWEIQFPAGQDNETAVAEFFGVKAQFELAGVDFPTQLLMPLLVDKDAQDGGRGMRVVITLAEVRTMALRTVTSSVELVPLATGEGDTARPLLTLHAETEFGNGETVDSVMAHLRRVYEAQPDVTVDEADRDGIPPAPKPGL